MFTSKLRHSWLFLLVALSLAILLITSLASTASATLIEDLIGDVSLAPVAITLDTPDAATAIDGTLHVVGAHNGQAARQLVDLTTGVAGAIEFFDSLASAAGGTGDTSGLIREVTQLTTGELLYVGNSAGSFDTSQPTSWLVGNNPQGGVGPFGTQVSGAYHGVSQNGIIVGNPNAVYATHGNLPISLPGGAISAHDITRDANFIVGDLLWEKNTLGGYDVLDTSGFNFTASGGAPTWEAVAIDPIVGDAVIAGSYLDLTTFTNKVGFWRADGTFLFSSEAGTDFRDFEVYEGELVAAVAGGDDSFLYAISDFSMIALETILGVTTQVAPDGLFKGSIGILGEDSDGNFFATTVSSASTSADFDEDGDVDGHDFLKWQRGESPGLGSASDLALWEDQFGSVAPVSGVFNVPEPSTLVLMSLAFAGGLFCRRRRCHNS